MSNRQRTAVVTGASSGIGAATARALAAAGFRVTCAARREDRVATLADEIGGVALRCDVTSLEDVRRLAETVGDRLDVLVNNAGQAFGADEVAVGRADDWRKTYDVNVIGTLNVTRELLPALIASGDAVLINMGSTAGRIAYEGGGAYTAAKHAVAVMTETLRLELLGQPVRVTEMAPGMVATEEFSLHRFRGDQAKRDAVYAGVREPLTAADVASAVAWVATRPSHVNVDLMVLRPRAQATQAKVYRED
ncbi:MAG: SDR family NAD(P)-dependent oxidoreductase [Propionibacteriales bacterium]|nr:SDR family NAD(P)-dependent oxidoreductase [Propionibacteriales bacterium]